MAPISVPIPAIVRRTARLYFKIVDKPLLQKRTENPWPQQQHMSFPVGDELYSRLDSNDIAAVRAAFTLEDERQWQAAQHNPALLRYLILHFGIHHGVKGIAEKTGLSAAAPPADVHAMARGSLTSGGSLYYADLVMGSLQDAGVRLAAGAAVLDFGASSGRVIRVLNAWRPEWRCSACDPNDNAVAWAKGHLPKINFFTSPLRPPLALPAESQDLIYAISIWSHFNQAPAQAWWDEMWRLLKPGGHLLFTLHGLASIAYYSKNHLRSRKTLREASSGLSNDGFHFWPCFGEKGDWGVKDAEWGEAYMSVEWLANRLAPKWKIRQYRSGFVEYNQDLVVLEKTA